jgi:hypothetical protein
LCGKRRAHGTTLAQQSVEIIVEARARHQAISAGQRRGTEAGIREIQ